MRAIVDLERLRNPAPVAVESAEPVAERPVAVPQNVPDKNEDIVTMVMLKHADPEKISSILAAFGVKVVTSNSPNAVILTGPEKAIEVAMDDQAFIPVFYPIFDYAAKKGLKVTHRPERRFNALMVRPEK